MPFNIMISGFSDMFNRFFWPDTIKPMVFGNEIGHLYSPNKPTQSDPTQSFKNKGQPIPDKQCFQFSMNKPTKFGRSSEIL